MVRVVAHGSQRIPSTCLGSSSSVGASDGRLAAEGGSNLGEYCSFICRVWFADFL